MRVLVVHNRYRSANPSGENSVVDEEVALLREHGCDVDLLQTSSDVIAQWSWRRRATLPARIIWSRDGYRLTAGAIERFHPDVVHFQNTFPLLSPSSIWAAHRSGATVVQTLHNFRPLCPAATFFRDGAPCEDCLGRLQWPSVQHACYRSSRAATIPLAASNSIHTLMRTWHRCVDAFLVPSEFARSRYVAAGWPAQRLVVKYNTVRAFRQAESERAGFVCVSRLTYDKGVDLLVDAWRTARAQRTETLSIIGAGPEEGALRRQAQGLPSIRFLGQLTTGEARRRIAAARVVLMPSRWYEVFPRVVVEAYAAGTPVVGSLLGSLQELIEDGRTGLLVAGSSADAWAEAVDRVASVPGLSEKLGAGARAAYESRYSADATVAAQLEVYRRAHELANGRA